MKKGSDIIPKHKKPCPRLSENNMLCIDRCWIRAETNRNCRDCIYVNTLRCETLKKRFGVNRPSEINYQEFERRSNNDRNEEE